MSTKKWFCIPLFVLILFGSLIGSINALVWVFGYIPFVRAMIPYALIFVIILFIATAILKARCGNVACGCEERHLLSATCASAKKYSPLLMITAAIFIVFSLVVLATHLPFLLRTILAFIGSISFWTMLLDFLAMISCIFCKK